MKADTVGKYVIQGEQKQGYVKAKATQLSYYWLLLACLKKVMFFASAGWPSERGEILSCLLKSSKNMRVIISKVISVSESLTVQDKPG